jgi:sugar O-acyltransferase (sialic acid O-acetyltransferase NeuD family)
MGDVIDGDVIGTVIVGDGGHARVVADALGERIVGHLAPRDRPVAHADLLGPRLGGDADAPSLAASGHQLAVGVGFVDRAGALRRADLVDRLHGIELAVVQHPASMVSSSATLGAGTFVGAGAVVGVGATIGLAAIVNSGAVVDHDCSIGRNAHIAPGAVLSGGVTVGDHTLIGAGASVIQGVTIGPRCVVGAGSVVVEDLPADVTVVGAPARVIEQYTAASPV